MIYLAMFESQVGELYNNGETRKHPSKVSCKSDLNIQRQIYLQL